MVFENNPGILITNSYSYKLSKRVELFHTFMQWCGRDPKVFALNKILVNTEDFKATRTNEIFIIPNQPQKKTKSTINSPICNNLTSTTTTNAMPCHHKIPSIHPNKIFNTLSNNVVKSVSSSRFVFR